MAILYIFRDPNNHDHVLLVPVRTGWEDKVKLHINDDIDLPSTCTCTCGKGMVFEGEQSGTTEYEPRCTKTSKDFHDDRKAPGA